LRWVVYGLAAIGAGLGVLAAVNADPVWAALALIAPLPALGLALTAPELFQVKQRTRGRVFNPLVGAGAFTLPIAALQHHLLSGDVQLIAALAGASAALAIAALAPGRTRLEAPIVFLALCALLGASYGDGAVALADVRFDASVGQVFPVTVNGKYVSRGRSTSYELELPPWGPQAMRRSVAVSRSTYDAVQIGDPVCVTLHPGALGAPWFAVGLCPPPGAGAR
jgi:hypothetical protein